MKKVSDCMTRRVASVRDTDRASQAARLMWDCDCGAVPVVDESGRCLAMITDRDVCMAATIQDRAPSAIPVSEAMSHNLHFCSPQDTIATAEQIMRAYQIRRIPVLDSNRQLVGILSLADIVRAEEREKGRKEIAPEEVTATLADICTPRQPAEVWAGA